MYYLIVTQGESSDDANNFQIGTQYEDKATLQHHAKLWHINDSRECIAVRSSPTVLIRIVVYVFGIYEEHRRT